jgi:4-amino-4-deoxy-L-arabinose transferase-like glycosyltransferase
VVYVLPAGRAILDDGDALYAQVAKQMLDQGDWITPHANGVRFLDKPPLLYWFMAISFSIFGEREWAARLPAALAVFGTGWLLFRIGIRTGSLSAGITAALAFVLSAGTFLFTLNAFPDILLVFLISLAMSCFLRWYLKEGKEHWPVFGFFASLAGAFMTKGMIGVVFPVVIAGLFLLLSKERYSFRVPTRLAGAGFLLFLALVLPWHLLAEWRNPDFFQHYFINEQVLRFLGKRQPVDYSSIPLHLFWALLLVWFFPWSAFLPLLWKERKVMSGPDPQTAAIARLSFYWAGVVLAFFSFSSRIEHYSFPVLPPLALLVGIILSSQPERAREPSRKAVDRTFGVLAILGLLFALTTIGVFVWYKKGGAELLADGTLTHHTQAYTNFFSPLFHLPSSTRSALLAPLLGTLMTFSIGMLAAWWINKRGRRLGGILTLAIMMAAFSFLALHSLRLCEGVVSSKSFGVFLEKASRYGDKLIIVGDYETANSISFYAPIELLVYQGAAASLDHGLRYPDAPRMILSRQDLESLWGGEERIFLLAPSAHIQDLGLSPSFAVFACSGRTLFCNKPMAAGA